MKKEKGLTLVALTVTIIILIILAGISLNFIVGDNGLFSTAKKAKENMQIAQQEESEMINYLDEETFNQLKDIHGTYESVIYQVKEEYKTLEKEFEEFRKQIAEKITQKGVETTYTDSIEQMKNNMDLLKVGTPLKEYVLTEKIFRTSGQSPAIFNISSIVPNYKKLVLYENMVILPWGTYASGFGGGTYDAPITGVTYDATTGRVSVSSSKAYPGYIRILYDPNI